MPPVWLNAGSSAPAATWAMNSARSVYTPGTPPDGQSGRSAAHSKSLAKIRSGLPVTSVVTTTELLPGTGSVVEPLTVTVVEISSGSTRLTFTITSSAGAIELAARAPDRAQLTVLPAPEQLQFAPCTPSLLLSRLREPANETPAGRSKSTSTSSAVSGAKLPTVATYVSCE